MCRAPSDSNSSSNSSTPGLQNRRSNLACRTPSSYATDSCSEPGFCPQRVRENSRLNTYPTQKVIAVPITTYQVHAILGSKPVKTRNLESDRSRLKPKKNIHSQPDDHTDNGSRFIGAPGQRAEQKHAQQ